MLRLTLIIVLVAVTASTKHVSKVRRQDDHIYQTCDYQIHPYEQCRPRDCTYPVYLALEQVWRLEDVKRILLKEDNLEKLCSEAGALLRCAISAYDGSPAKCKQEYNRRYSPLTREMLENGVTFLSDICDDDVIESIRSSLDCVLDEKLLQSTEKCFYPNMDRNCSGISYTDDYTEIRACYQSKYSKNCNADELVECASKKVTSACDEDAGELIKLLGDAFFETVRFPVCPTDGINLRTLLKFFKK